MRGRASDIYADRPKLYGFLFPDQLSDRCAVGFAHSLMFMIEIAIMRHAEFLFK
jgi:hypothetical protein